MKKRRVSTDISYAIIIAYGALFIVAAIVVSIFDHTPTALSTPVILSSDCDYWVDQYGNKVSIETADEYFGKNYRIGRTIAWLNSDQNYSPFYNAARKKFLEKKQAEWCENWDCVDRPIPNEREYRDQYFEIYQTVLSHNRPSTDALDLISKKLGNDFDAKILIRRIRHDCITTQEIKAFENPSTNICATYFACLAKFSEDGTLTGLCNP